MSEPTNPGAMPHDTPTLPQATRQQLMLQLEHYEHLLFEPLRQQEYAALERLARRWRDTLGESAEASALHQALGDFIIACRQDHGRHKDRIKRTYMALFATVRRGGRA